MADFPHETWSSWITASHERAITLSPGRLRRVFPLKGEQQQHGADWDWPWPPSSGPHAGREGAKMGPGKNGGVGGRCIQDPPILLCPALIQLVKREWFCFQLNRFCFPKSSLSCPWPELVSEPSLALVSTLKPFVVFSPAGVREQLHGAWLPAGLNCNTEHCYRIISIPLLYPPSTHLLSRGDARGKGVSNSSAGSPSPQSSIQLWQDTCSPCPWTNLF